VVHDTGSSRSELLVEYGYCSRIFQCHYFCKFNHTYYINIYCTCEYLSACGWFRWFNISAGQSLIIGGPFDAPIQKVFFGTGSPYFYGSNVSVLVLPQWFGATGNGKAMGYNVTAGNATITLRPLSVNNFVTGDVVTMVGAGTSGANLTATLTVSGGVITTSPAAITTVSDLPIYNEDDSAALNAWTNSVRGNMS